MSFEQEAARVYNPVTGAFENVEGLYKSFNDYVDYPTTNLAANVATNIVKTATAGKTWYLAYANWRVSGTAPVGASNLALQILDGATVVYQSAIPGGSTNGTALQIVFGQSLKGTLGNSMSITIATPNNAGCIIYCNAGFFQR